MRLPTKLIEEQDAFAARVVPPPSLGLTLRYLRQLKGLGQNELAEYLDCNQNAIADIEGNNRRPSAPLFKRIKRLARELGLD